MIIGSLNSAQRIVIVAEIGNNHEGDYQVAVELVRSAAACGVDAVKFQTFRTDHYVSKADEARYKRLKTFELTEQQFGDLAALTRSLGLRFLSTPFDLESARVLRDLVDAYKIASGDITFYPLIQSVCQTAKPIILSSGASSLDQVKTTERFISDQWRRQGIASELAILHCVSSYPVPPAQANLRAIACLRETFPCTIGYSDHTEGIEACLLAVGLGAQIIEKHFTLDKNFSDFRDHRLSADPSEMKVLVERLRAAEAMLGAPAKGVQPCEEAMALAIRRSIVACSDLPAGHRISAGDLTWVRPAGGLAPGQEDQLIGRTLVHAVKTGERITSVDVG